MTVPGDDLEPDDPTQNSIRVGGLVDRSTVTLALYGEDLDPAALTAALKCDPSDAHKKGDPRLSKRASPHSRGAWMLSVSCEAPRSPADLVQALLARVPADGELWNGLAKRFDIQLRFGIFQEAWNRGFDLPAELVERIGTLRATLVFDIYAELEGDQDD